jgi:hypothetical protein
MTSGVPSDGPSANSWFAVRSSPTVSPYFDAMLASESPARKTWMTLPAGSVEGPAAFAMEAVSSENGAG